MNNEIWKDIKGYEGLYQISNYGNVKTLDYNHTKKEKQMKPILQVDGYLGINLMKDGKRKRYRIHRLVLETFTNNKNNYPVVNHKDGNKTNNCLDNLEWCSISYNTQHSYDMGLEKTKKVVCYDLKNKRIKIYKNVKELSNELNLNINSIYGNIRLNKCFKNYIFEYLGEQYE